LIHQIRRWKFDENEYKSKQFQKANSYVSKTLVSGSSIMSRKLILISLTIVCLFFQFGFKTDATATNRSLVSFSSGALLVEKAPEYSSGWSNIWIMDENPRTGWCCPKGKI